MENERNISPEMREFELNQQIDAVTRAIEMLNNDGEATVDEIIESLAGAETDAQFLCGFVDLNQHDAEKKGLEKELVVRGFATIEGGKIKLTEQGKKRAQTPLPPQIEEALR